MKYLQLIVVIFCLAAGFFAGKSCTRPEIIDNSTHTSDTLTTYDTIIDSIPYPVITKVPVPYAVIETDTVYIYKDTDSTLIKQVFEDYFLTRLYDETIVDDSNARIRLKFNVNKNKLAGYTLEELTLFHKKITESNTVTNTIKHRGMIAIGIGVGYNPLNNDLPLAGKIKYLDNKFRIYGISINPFAKIYEGEVSFPIFKW